MINHKFQDTAAGRTITGLVKKADHRALAVWAADCAKRVLPLFEDAFPEAPHPRNAIRAARKWARDGVFRMADVRKTALDSHAAARKAPKDSAACFAARAAGHAIATAHVKTHSIAAAWYAAKAVWAGDPQNGPKNVRKERLWQNRRLIELASRGNIKPCRGKRAMTGNSGNAGPRTGEACLGEEDRGKTGMRSSGRRGNDGQSGECG